MARLQEQSIAALMKKNKLWLKTQGGVTTTSNYKSTGAATPSRMFETTKSYTNKPIAERLYTQIGNLSSKGEPQDCALSVATSIPSGTNVSNLG